MEFDQRQFRDALGSFPSGVTVITTGSDPNFVGMTVQSFCSLSLDPPLILVCIDKNASTLPLLQQTGAFTVNVLAGADQDASNYFASSKRPPPPRQFDDIPHRLGDTGTPRIDSAPMVFDCRLHDVLDGGDHVIAIGRVEAFEAQSEAEPLLYYRGAYRTLAHESG